MIGDIKGIVFSGGSISMIRSLGLIKYLNERDLIKNIKVFSGNSFGSIIATMMAIGMSYDEILAEMSILRIDDAIDTSFDDIVDNVVYYGGVDDGSNFISTMISIFEKKQMSFYTTFEELFEKTGNYLLMPATKIQNFTTTYFNIQTSPKMRIIDAVRASMSIPIIYEPVKYKGFLYCDGGLLDNYPFSATQKFMSDLIINPQDLYGIKLFRQNNPTSKLENTVDIYTQYATFFFASSELSYDIDHTLEIDYMNNIGIIEDISLETRLDIINDAYERSKLKWN